MTRVTDIRSILFDMDGVLYAYDFENRLNLLESATGVAADTIRAKVFDSGLERAGDIGELNTDAYIAAINDALDVEVTLRQWLAARKWAMAPEPAVIDLARELASKMPVALLTNNGMMMAEHLGELAPELPPLFGDHVYVSGQCGFDKETVNGFAGLLDQLGWLPATTLFIDDNAGYIANADTAGLATHLFRDPGLLRDDLTARGLIG